MLINHGHPVADGAAGDPLAGTDLGPDRSSLDSLASADEVGARLPIQGRDGHEVGGDDAVGPRHERSGHVIGLLLQADGTGELV